MDGGLDEMLGGGYLEEAVEDDLLPGLQLLCHCLTPGAFLLRSSLVRGWYLWVLILIPLLFAFPVEIETLGVNTRRLSSLFFGSSEIFLDSKSTLNDIFLITDYNKVFLIYF